MFINVFSAQKQLPCRLCEAQITVKHEIFASILILLISLLLIISEIKMQQIGIFR